MSPSLALNKVHEGDCLELMSGINPGSIDLILCDLPYGTTQSEWDIVIPLEPLWRHYARVLKPGGVVVLTASQPFTSELVMSNRPWFRFEDVWDKKSTSSSFNCNKMPLRRHEAVLVFSPAKLGNFTYNPQMRTGVMRKKGGRKPKAGDQTYNIAAGKVSYNDQYYPTSVLEFSAVSPSHKVHPSQKPLELFEYLIRSYSNQGDTVLDNCAGSGTTGIAAIRLRRNFILIEKHPDYARGCHARITTESQQDRLLELA